MPPLKKIRQLVRNEKAFVKRKHLLKRPGFETLATVGGGISAPVEWRVEAKKIE